MEITLYTNHSDNIVVNKNIELLISLSGNFRIANSLLTPSLDIESNGIIKENYELSYDDNIETDISILEDTSIFKCNYIYIHDLKRYYFVRDIIIINNKLYQFQLVEDTIVSLKEQYLKLDAIVERNQYRYDLNLEDNKMTYEFYQNVDEYDLGNNNFFNTTLDSASTNYYLSVVEKGASYDGNLINGVASDLPSVNYTTAGINKFKKSYATSVVNINNLADVIVEHSDYGSFLASLVAYPFQIETENNFDYLTLGNTLIPSVIVYETKDTQSKYHLIASFYVNNYVGWGDDYMKREPYSTYELYLPYYGYVELKSSDILNNLIEIYYSFDYANGTAKINIYNKTKEYIIKSVTANIGVKISLNRTNYQELSDAKTQLAIQSAISGVASALSIGVGAVTSNPYLLSSGVTGLVSTAIDVSTKLTMMHEKAQTSNNTGLEGLYGSQNVKLKVTRYVKREPSNYSSYYGRPLIQTIKLNQLVGFTTIKEIHLDDVDATKIEKDDLLNKLFNGIIL